MDDILKNARRVGIIGGAFDPIHYGHLTAAECTRCEMNLDFVLFIPTGQPPHKGKITFSEHRYLMAVLATADNGNFHITRMELDRPGPSYTVDTLRFLKENTDAELFFIIGADEKIQISSWKDSDQLPGLCNWFTVTRPGYNVEDAVKIPGIDISGTELRKRIKSNQPVKYLIPPAVERYISELDLYRTDYEKIHQAVAAQLTKKRYQHTLGVIETAILLAARYGVDMKKAYLSALLHDYAKEFTEDRKHELCKKFNVSTDTIQKQNINLMHGSLSAEFARREFGVSDQEVLDAIIYHTTGRAGMGKLERIIKIADNIEPNRTYFPGLEEIRRIAKINLNRATIASLRRDMEYTKGKGRTLHPWGGEALADLIKGEEMH